MTAKLTPKQEAFALAYLETGNAAEAYRRAYSASRMGPASIQAEAGKLLANPSIALRIDELQAAIVDASIMTATEIQQRLSAIGRANLSDIGRWGAEGFSLFDSDDLSEETKAAVAVIKVKRKRIWIGTGDNAEPWEIEELEAKLHDPITAMRELNKLQGNHAPERHEHSGPRGRAIPVEVSTKEPFDHDGYARLFSERLADSEHGPANEDGS